METNNRIEISLNEVEVDNLTAFYIPSYAEGDEHLPAAIRAFIIDMLITDIEFQQTQKVADTVTRQPYDNQRGIHWLANESLHELIDVSRVVVKVEWADSVVANLPANMSAMEWVRHYYPLTVEVV